MATGIYKTQTPESGAEYASVDYGMALAHHAIPRYQYEAQGYEPPFDELPTKQEFEARKNPIDKPDEKDDEAET